MPMTTTHEPNLGEQVNNSILREVGTGGEFFIIDKCPHGEYWSLCTDTKCSITNKGIVIELQILMRCLPHGEPINDDTFIKLLAWMKKNAWKVENWKANPPSVQLEKDIYYTFGCSVCDHTCEKCNTLNKGNSIPSDSGEITSNVNHPSHYTNGDIECIDAIHSALGDEGFINFCRGNVLKYNWRAGLKNDRLEDMKKAQWYQERMIAVAEKLKLTGDADGKK